MRILILILSLVVVTPVFAADGGEPATKAPTTEVAPASAPVAPAGSGEVEGPKAATGEEAAKGEVSKEKEVTWWKVLVSHLMELAFALLGLLLSGLVTVLMRKYGFEAQSAKINELLGKAVGYAEQKAAAAAKLEEGKKTSGAEKMELAVQFAERLAKDYKIKSKGKDWWEDRLESWLGVQKNGVSK